MPASKKPCLGLLNKHKHAEIATFKNSLRLWQARWKAQKAAQGETAKEPAKCLSQDNA